MTTTRFSAPAAVLIVASWTSAALAEVPLPPPAQGVPEKIEYAEGPFKPTWESLTTYKCPEWFRDAKLGFWAIQGVQSLPEAGDWYARHMYIEGHPQYLHHLKTYGHPSVFGYKDLAAAWKDEKLDADRLAELYKKAGAKYLVVLANHHDNWDNWNSRYHRWNSVNVGPKKDIVGLWAAAAKKHGLRLGVTEHLARSYTWFNTNKGADKKGPYAGKPYDGNDPKYVDLYFPPHPDTSGAYPVNGPEWWPRTYYYRIRDLVDTYEPDLLYTDGAVPYGEVGRKLIAHFYNANIARHGGRLEAVYNLKDCGRHSTVGEYVDGLGVQDVERGALQAIKSEPWQTDTCIGDWFYRTGLKYKPVRTVVAMLADIVAKNGNLLLNIPLKHDGTIDADEEKFLAGLAEWIAVNGEAIYGTRPWQVYGEGRSRMSGGHFNEGIFAQMGLRDIRFTTRLDVLYAIVMGWPEASAAGGPAKVTVRSLARPAEAPQANRIAKVGLLGGPAELTFTQDQAGLHVTMPDKKPCEHAVCLVIRGSALQAVPVVNDVTVQPGNAQRPAEDGRIVLRAADAQIHGSSPQYESGGGKDQIGYWADARDYVSWRFQPAKAGTYAVEVEYSCAAGAQGSQYVAAVDPQSLTGTSRASGSWATYVSDKLGTLRLEAGKPLTLTVKPKQPPVWKVIGLKSVTLSPQE